MKALALTSVLVLAAAPCLAEVLENKAISIVFGTPEQGFGVKGITNHLAGGRGFVRGSEHGVDFWALIFHSRGADGKTTEARVDNRAPAADRKTVRRRDCLEFVWSGMDLPGERGVLDVTARVRLVGKAASAWEIDVVNRSSSWGLFETHYPYLRGVVEEGEADVMLPAQGLGARLYRKHRSADFLPPSDWNYPGWYPMVAAFMQGEAGLFAAPYDGAARIKRLRFLKGHDLTFPVPVENAGVPGKAARGPGFPVIVAAYRGDWHEAAKIYRKWALRQKWCAKGPLLHRADAPRRMSESHAWLLCIGGPGGASNFVTRVKGRYPDAKFAVEWTQWGNQPFDVNYPEMLPAQRGVEKAMAYATSIGVPLMPYANGRLWDSELCSWRYAKGDCTEGEDGLPNMEKYGPPHRVRTFGVMCPHARGWQEAFGEYVVRLCDVTQCGLVYLDQIACSRPKLCFAARHGHPAGGGSWWADGYRRLLAPAHDVLSRRNVPITSEGAAEAWLDVIDGYLLACCPMPEDIPFYTSVYGGYATYFGSYLHPSTDFPSYWAITARATAWGVAPGWYHVWPMDAGKERFGDALAYCARFREEAKEFLAYGHLAGDVHFETSPGLLDLSWPNPMNGGANTVSGKLPEVMGTVWMNADDSKRGIVLANLSGREVKVRVVDPVDEEVVLAPNSLKLIKR
jgi:hypothetical protein